MVKLLIVADDLSGALDTAVSFSADNINTLVSVNTNIRECVHANPDAAVLAVDVKTRHLDPAKAYSIIFDIVKEAIALGIPYIYNKGGMSRQVAFNHNNFHYIKKKRYERFHFHNALLYIQLSFKTRPASFS